MTHWGSPVSDRAACPSRRARGNSLASKPLDWPCIQAPAPLVLPCLPLFRVGEHQRSGPDLEGSVCRGPRGTQSHFPQLCSGNHHMRQVTCHKLWVCATDLGSSHTLSRFPCNITSSNFLSPSANRRARGDQLSPTVAHRSANPFPKRPLICPR
jgi:hypothetical protein